MIKRILFVALAVFSLLSCSTVKNTYVALPLSEVLPSTSKYSNGFRMFWSDFTKEVNEKSKMDNYRPSQALVENYALREDNGSYYLSGYVTVKPEAFNEDEAVKAGVALKEMTADIYTYSCDVKNLPSFVKLDGILYLEIAQKVHQRIY